MQGQRASLVVNKCRREYWSKRYPVPLPVNAYAKRLTHRFERLQAKIELRRADG